MTRKPQTVKDLKDFIDYYLKEVGSEDDEIKVIDDGMKAAFFDVEVICGTNFQRKIDDYGHFGPVQNVLAMTIDKYREV